MKIFIYLFTFLLFTYQLYPQWNQEHFISNDEPLWRVYFVDENTGWISGGGSSERYLYKTIDGGNIWTKSIFPDTYPLQSIFFLNENKGWAVGDSGKVITTSDGVNSWYFQNTGINRFLSSVYFIDENNGWICYGYGVGFPLTTYYGVILHTTNGGEDWIIQKEVEKYQFKSIFFVDHNTGWAAGYNHQNKTEIYTTIDGGNTWVTRLVNTIWRFFYSVQFADNLTGWLVGESGIIIKTTDGGNNWFEQTNGYQGYHLYSCYVVDQNKGYAAGQYGTILYTSNGGEIWTEQESGTNNTLNSIYFTDEMRGWAVGYGVVLSTTNGGVTFVEEVSTETPKGYILSQNYPNPFNPVTTINYQIPKESTVKLNVFDCLGNEIETLVNEFQTGGMYSLKFDASKLTSGIYFYQLKATDFISTKKMVVMQ
jgi:photosystem II stability/assembly factor-like uncharacterized protein